MPKVILTNDGIRDTVIRPIVLDIAKQVQEWTGLAPMRVLFNGDTEAAPQGGSTIDDEPSFNKTSSEALWRIQARDEHRIEKLASVAVHQMEHPEYFYDEALNVFLRPVYSPTLLTLDFEYRATDGVAARRWRDEIRTKIAMTRDSRTHIVNYSYLVPEQYFPLLKHIHDLRESQAGYDEDYETWLRNSFTKNTTILTTMAGHHDRWAVREQQCRILGKFTFSDIPDEPTKRGEDSAYIQAFSYQIYFDCPIATAADYPLMVHNQLIDERYWSIPDKDDIKKAAWRSPHSSTALGAFEVQRLARNAVSEEQRFPSFHEFFPRYVPRYTTGVYTALIGISPKSEEDPQAHRVLMNLAEFDEEQELREEFVKHLKWDHKFLNKYGESLVSVSVYDGDTPIDHDAFHVDENLNVVLNSDPDLRRIYYVRLALLTDPNLLSEAAKDRQRDNPDGLVLIGATLCPALVANKLLPRVIGDNYMPRAEADKFLKRISLCQASNKQGFKADHEFVNRASVMVLYKQAHNRT